MADASVHGVRNGPGAAAVLAAVVGSLGFMLMVCTASADSTAPSAAGSAQQSFLDGPDATGDWGGARTRLADQGISFGGSWAMEGFDNFRGGSERGIVGASTVDANATLDMRKLAGLTGGEIYVDLEDHAGGDPDGLVGDLQTIDKLNWTPYLQVFEFWYQQKLFGDRLRVKIGKVDANSEFSVIDNGLDFFDASTQVTPTLLGFTTTPDPMPTIDLFYTPRNSIFYLDLSAADANRNDHLLDFYGQPWAIQPTPNGQLLIGESGLTWDTIPGFAANGDLRIGTWEDTGTFTQFNGRPQDGAQGFYSIFNQTLWQPAQSADGKRGVGTFLEYAETDRTVSPIDQHYGGGVSWTGPCAGRAQDALGVSAEYAHVSVDAGLPDSYELLEEVFYQAQATGWADVEPDLQYIVHPGGHYQNALVGILKLQIAL